ncbi:MAG TPA: hypothetical protein EYQ42_12255 [Thiotrichaceae bacterium]|jgi:hypothetical protein|nr:hypothetical protein [Thiotrichaceae bacterium]HIM08816.1 hypothetical protein [Gammaproteobacteria bacterium]
MKKLTYFKSITSKIRLIIFVTIWSLIFIYINSTAYQNSLNNLHHQVAKISQQKESLRSLKTILLSSLLILDKIIYEDNQELIPKLLAFNEDTLGEFERFKYTAEYQEQQFDYYFAVENENVVLQIRKDFYQSVALYQAGEIEKAKQYKYALLEPKINHIEIFIENAEELQKIQLADLNVLIQEQTRNSNPFKNATVIYLIILIIVVALILFISEKISLTEKH